MAAKAEYDVAIVGASLSGCTAAILLGRVGGADDRAARALRADPRGGRRALPLSLANPVGVGRTDREAGGLLPQPASQPARPDAAGSGGRAAGRRADAGPE